MRFHRYLHNRRRAISPAIATLLLITIAVAGSAAIATIVSNLDSESQGVDTASVSFGSTSGSSFQGSLTLHSLTVNPILFQQGIDDYVRLIVKLDYTGEYDQIYVYDLDIYVYGEKLDDFSQWSIVKAADADTGSILNQVQDEDGSFLGYVQEKETSALYTIDISDMNNRLGRLSRHVSFVYSLKVGNTPGIVSHLFINEELSKTVFNAIWYRVGIFHHNQDPLDTSTAFSGWENTLSDINGTNKAYFNYSRSRDSFDTSGDLSSINATAMGEEYDIVISANWAIVPEVSNIFNSIHSSNTSMLFYGSIIHNNVYQNLNTTASEVISGLTPTPSLVSIPGGLGRLFYVSSNSYSFNSSTDLLMLTLSGQSGITDDIEARDAATRFSSEISSYGEMTYDVDPRWGGGSTFDHTGPLLTVKEKNATASTGISITFTGNHLTIQSEHANAIRRNMMFRALESTERLSETYGEYYFTQLDVSRFWRWVTFDIAGSVIGGDVLDNTLIITLMMDGNFDWNSFAGSADINIGSTLYQNVPFTIDSSGVNDTIVFDLGALHSGNIADGTGVSITFTQRLRRNNNAIPDSYEWRVDAEYQDIRQITKTSTIIQKIIP
ncbi:MAG: hypothetical protein ACXAD7_10675 [Candidatus Kariarchaeaceae archaeon]|jgi:FlaG/FlaF family flagellin (archaellin)